MALTLAGLFLLIISIGVPIAFALGIASVVVFLLTNPDFLILLPKRMFSGLDLFALIAVPFFILAGELMGSSGILDRILAMSRMVAGHIRGSSAQVTILVSMLFGWINGSGVAGTSAVGSMLIPPMTERYNNGAFASALTACSSIIGPIIPPSVPMIIYALIAQNVSVGGMFAAGIIPGLMLAVGMMSMTYFIARVRGYSTEGGSYTRAEVFVVLRRFMIALILPIILIGGIVGGVFTPVEAGGVAVFYAMLVGFFVTKSLTFESLSKSLVNTGVISSVVFLMMGIANFAGWYITTEQVPMRAAGAISELTTNPLMFLLMVNIILLIAGLFFDAVAAMVMFVPILVPISVLFGIDPVHFGMVVIVNLMIGLVTPPVGMCLFIAAGIAKVKLTSVFVEALPFLFVLFVVLGIVTFLPGTYLWLPKALGY